LKACFSQAVVGRSSAFGRPCDKQYISPWLTEKTSRYKGKAAKAKLLMQIPPSALLLGFMGITRKKAFHLFFSFVSQHNSASPVLSDIIGYRVQIHEI